MKIYGSVGYLFAYDSCVFIIPGIVDHGILNPTTGKLVVSVEPFKCLHLVTSVGRIGRKHQIVHDVCITNSNIGKTL